MIGVEERGIRGANEVPPESLFHLHLFNLQLIRRTPQSSRVNTAVSDSSIDSFAKYRTQSTGKPHYVAKRMQSFPSFFPRTAIFHQLPSMLSVLLAPSPFFACSQLSFPLLCHFFQSSHAPGGKRSHFGTDTQQVSCHAWTIIPSEPTKCGGSGKPS